MIAHQARAMNEGDRSFWWAQNKRMCTIFMLGIPWHGLHHYHSVQSSEFLLTGEHSTF